ncbi:MAG: outer membrane lipoprotein carrier protein LolA, partial [bacterium]|nr:outer membrane lipoprotein carrier protein LolA [bacterium]
MTKNTAITAGLLLLIFTSVFAQQAKEVVDQKAKAILDEVAAKTKAYTSIKTEFESSAIKKVSNTETKVSDTQTGTLQLKGEKYKLEIKGQVIICDGKTQWTYIKESNEVQVNNAPDPDATDTPSPINIFTLYEKGYKYKFEKEDVSNGVKV